MQVRADGCSSGSSRQISRISCCLTSADKPDYFVTGKPAAHGADVFVTHFLQALGERAWTPDIFRGRNGK